MSYEVSPRTRAHLAHLLALPQVSSALAHIAEDQPRSIREQKRLTLIEAPTFHEAARAQALAECFRTLGLKDVHMDRGGNVLGLRPGIGGPLVLVEAHMDTVFPLGSVTAVRDEGGFLCAPGISDDTRGLAVLLSLVRGLDAAGIATCGTLLFAGTTREEGSGGMGGMKDLLADHPDIDASISVDSGSMGSIIYEATGLRTASFTFRGKGGHAFGAFGQVAQPLHAAARAVARLADFAVPQEPRTTFCASNLHAGNEAAVHAIPPTASLTVNYRSNDAAELERLHGRILQAVQDACDAETARWGRDAITWDMRLLCDIPAGTQDTHAPMVEGLHSILEQLGLQPRLLRGGATNASIAIGRGIPAVCLGTCFDPEGPILTYDHTLEERFPTAGAYRSAQAALLLALLCAGMPEAPSMLIP